MLQIAPSVYRPPESTYVTPPPPPPDTPAPFSRLQKVQERVAKREEAEVAEAKALARLEKAKALLAEASALVTVYVVRRGGAHNDVAPEQRTRQAPAPFSIVLTFTIICALQMCSKCRAT